MEKVNLVLRPVTLLLSISIANKHTLYQYVHKQCNFAKLTNDTQHPTNKQKKSRNFPKSSTDDHKF